MADVVTYSMNANQVVSAINLAFGSTIVSTSMNAVQFVDALNSAFVGGTGITPLATSMNAVTLVDTINANFEAMSVPVTPTKTVFKFLHLSDNHGFADALTQAKTELDNDSTIDALLFTGDWTGHAIWNNTMIYHSLNYGTINYNGSPVTSGTRQTAITTSEVNAAFNTIKAGHGSKLLMCVGNHDAYDNANGYGTQQDATTAIKGWMTDGVVIWGDSGGKASYWHKDITLSATSKLRIVALDQYENSYLGKRGQFSYWPLFTAAQMSWFVARLKELNPTDYLIIMLHEPAYQDDTAITGMLSDVSSNSGKLFLSEKLSKFNYKGAAGSINLLPRLMNAYLSHTSLTTTYENLNNGVEGTANNTTITINADFANGNQPCHFLFYIGGHRHCDIVTPMPSPFSNQLMMHIATSDYFVASSKDNDLFSAAQENYPNSYNANDRNVRVTGNGLYAINKVTIDFANGTIKIDRIGEQNTDGGRTRNTITFNI